MLSAREEQDRLLARVAGLFRRPEVRATALAYLAALLERGAGTHAKAVTANVRAVPATRITRLLQTAGWDEATLRDALREHVVEHLGDDRAILALREEPFSWRGRDVVGVTRQYVARTQRWRHCQLGLFLAYLAPGASTYLDRELYLPPEWVGDAERRRHARIPEERAYRSKGELAVAMLQRAYLAAVPGSWVVAERTFATDATLQAWLNGVGYAYLAEVSPIWSWRGLRGGEGSDAAGVGSLFETVPGSDWWREPASDSASSPTMEWACLATPTPRSDLTSGWQEWALAARPAGHRDRARYFVARAPSATSLADIVAVAARAASLDALAAEARAVGLGEYRTRTWRGWYRHTTLALLAHGCRAVSASARDQNSH